jgi:hypothetical protein
MTGSQATASWLVCSMVAQHGTMCCLLVSSTIHMRMQHLLVLRLALGFQLMHVF